MVCWCVRGSLLHYLLHFQRGCSKTYCFHSVYLSSSGFKAVFICCLSSPSSNDGINVYLNHNQFTKICVQLDFTVTPQTLSSFNSICDQKNDRRDHLYNLFLNEFDTRSFSNDYKQVLF